MSVEFQEFRMPSKAPYVPNEMTLAELQKEVEGFVDDLLLEAVGNISKTGGSGRRVSVGDIRSLKKTTENSGDTKCSCNKKKNNNQTQNQSSNQKMCFTLTMNF
ncbi:hypothetical protein LSTR_LSTR000428 [Laodelphax striatellus]|uniref:Uncharacterized protein n=1 Tax=Laodelphax striatellus TaxID=195883 RepID=A0A482X3V0_LAOST|nr:hypothetical protein LSTR_LSTR000428 [Laodelphax striatellus]